MAGTSSRLFEFLAAQKPIFGLVNPTGAAAELILATGAGIVVHPENTAEVAKAIRKRNSRY